ncbi:MAG: protein of unknown function DUF2313 [Bacteriophage sp.]|nr:MAG: protein of unknown function DUF2313 [Bacteriophage sp.]
MAKIIEHLPRYYIPSTIVKDLSQLYDIENDLLLQLIQDNLNQYNVNTATTALSRYEEEYGLTIKPSSDLDNRRGIIISKMKGYGTTTVAKIKNVIKSWSGYDVDIIESSTHESLENSSHEELSKSTHENLGGNDFIVKIFFKKPFGIPTNIDDIKKVLDEIKPAHLEFRYIYNWNTYGALKTKTNGQLKSYTYYQIKKGEVI